MSSSSLIYIHIKPALRVRVEYNAYYICKFTSRYIQTDALRLGTGYTAQRKSWTPRLFRIMPCIQSWGCLPKVGLGLVQDFWCRSPYHVVIHICEVSKSTLWKAEPLVTSISTRPEIARSAVMISNPRHIFGSTACPRSKTSTLSCKDANTSIAAHFAIMPGNRRASLRYKVSLALSASSTLNLRIQLLTRDIKT